MSWGPFISARSFLLLFLFLGLGSRICYCSGFGFDLHHRFSNPVKGILGFDGLPERGSVEYYAAMSHRDRLIRSRHLAASDGQTSPLTFVNGINEIVLINSLPFLHYANVSVGTPSLSFLVALDTGSDLFWLPCVTSSSTIIDLSIYSPSNSSTSKNVSYNSTLCGQTDQGPSANSNCPYNVPYLYSDTSSTGILVEDILRLITDDDQQKAVDTPITFGCGQNQTGIFLEAAAPNGLFGLGIESISVPSTLARNGLASDSFALCFGLDGAGKISFGNKGSSDQRETPFNISVNQTSYEIPYVNLTMKGGDTYFLNDPTELLFTEDGAFLYCLGLLKSEVNIDIIGQNFMTGYQIVFDRERMVLGWKDSNCTERRA